LFCKGVFNFIAEDSIQTSTTNNIAQDDLGEEKMVKIRRQDRGLRKVRGIFVYATL